MIQVLRRTISFFNLKLAMGKDLIHNLFLIHWPTLGQNILLNAINGSWLEGLIPPDYKVSTVLLNYKA